LGIGALILDGWVGEDQEAALVAGEDDVEPEGLEEEQGEMEGTPAHEHGYITAI
jgi:hypothetical protein